MILPGMYLPLSRQVFLQRFSISIIELEYDTSNVDVIYQNF